MRLSQGLWNSNAENADEVVWFVHTDRFQGFHSYDHYLQFWLDKRSLLRWYKTAYRFWENKKETAEIASRCCKNYSLTLQESGETPCLEVKCDFEHTLHFTLDLRSSISVTAFPVPDVLHVDRVWQDDNVPLDVHRGHHSPPHDHSGLLKGTRQPANILPLRMA